jgi:hypothetical protein
MLQGRRVAFRPGFPGGAGPPAQPGDYCKVPANVRLGRIITWLLVDPSDGAGSIIPENHVVTEHVDRTITVNPSLVMPSGWHGWLRAGVWTSV